MHKPRSRHLYQNYSVAHDYLYVNHGKPILSGSPRMIFKYDKQTIFGPPKRQNSATMTRTKATADPPLSLLGKLGQMLF